MLGYLVLLGRGDSYCWYKYGRRFIVVFAGQMYTGVLYWVVRLSILSGVI